MPDADQEALRAALATAKGLLGETAAAALADGDEKLIEARARTADGYDQFLLAAELADLLGVRAQASGTVTSFTSEGTSVTMTAADYFAAARALRGKAAGHSTGVGVIDIDTGTRAAAAGPLSDGYETWDGDLPTLHEWATPCP